MSPTLLSAALATVLFATAAVRAETHTITFQNNCGQGTPQLVLNGAVVSTGEPYTSNAPISGIAFLQTGPCGGNGESCTLLEMTLINPTVPGGGSSTDISLIAPHAFNVETSFAYYHGCNNTGADCANADCSTAFFNPNDNQVQVACEDNDVNLLLGFCVNATTLDPNNLGSSSEPSSSAPPASSAPPTSSPSASGSQPVVDPSSSPAVDPSSSPAVNPSSVPVPTSSPNLLASPSGTGSSASATPVPSSGAGSPVASPSSGAASASSQASAGRPSCRPRPTSSSNATSPSASSGSPSSGSAIPSSSPVVPSPASSSPPAASSIPSAPSNSSLPAPPSSSSNGPAASPSSGSATPPSSAAPSPSSSAPAPSSSAPAPSSSAPTLSPSSPAPSSSAAPSPSSPSSAPPSSAAAPSASPSTCSANERRAQIFAREAAPFPEQLRARYDSRRRHHSRTSHNHGPAF